MYQLYFHIAEKKEKIIQHKTTGQTTPHAPTFNPQINRKKKFGGLHRGYHSDDPLAPGLDRAL